MTVTYSVPNNVSTHLILDSLTRTKCSSAHQPSRVQTEQWLLPPCRACTSRPVGSAALLGASVLLLIWSMRRAALASLF